MHSCTFYNLRSSYFRNHGYSFIVSDFKQRVQKLSMMMLTVTPKHVGEIQKCM